MLVVAELEGSCGQFLAVVIALLALQGAVLFAAAGNVFLVAATDVSIHSTELCVLLIQRR